MSRVRAWVGIGLMVVGGAAAPAGAQISPGPLAAPHAGLEGTLQCGSCHGRGGKAEMSALCVGCHKEIQWLDAQGRGFHGRHVGERCASCHPDHAGHDFALISWPGGAPERFDHSLAGWPLAGAHDTLRCNACHTPKLRSAAVARLPPKPDATPGWVGLEVSCSSCHQDVHRGALNTDCTACHDASHWKPAPLFDHHRSDYPLTGKHETVRCSACHALSKPVPGGTLPAEPVFKPVAHADCASCHSDPHRGRFSGPCRECHVTTGFNVIDRGNFNHDHTHYPLRGRHASVACAACHEVPGRPSRNPPFATCTACHTDPHAGTATLAGAAVDCDACHDVGGFTVSTYTAAPHDQARFRLEGKHAQVACLACHLKHPPGVPATRLGSAGVWLRPDFSQCRDCHADDHGGQLATRADRGECSTCHRPAGWRPSTFTIAAHATLRLALDGRHADIPCGACHDAEGGRHGLAPLTLGQLGKAKVAFHLTELECVSCHVDPHQGRFAARGARLAAEGCSDCHTTRVFRPSTVDVAAHDRYAFKLEGAHRAVPCVGCHAELRYPQVTSTLVQARWIGAPLLFAAKEQGCGTCHQNPHGDQFASEPDRGKCDRCHGLDAFRPASRFDHDRDTPFSLRGGHASVPCARCHAAVTGPGNTRVVRYRGVSGRCEDCHGGGTPP